MEKENSFVSNDLFLSSYLSYRGIPPALENRNNRVVFIFPQSDTLYKLINAYSAGDAVPITEYIDAYRTLKIKMFNARGGAR